MTKSEKIFKSKKFSATFCLSSVYAHVTTDGTQVLEAPTLPGDLAACHALIQQLLEQLDNATRKITPDGAPAPAIAPPAVRALVGEDRPQATGLVRRDAQDSLRRRTRRPSRNLLPLRHRQRPIARATAGGGFPPTCRASAVIHDLPENEKPCPCCGTMRTSSARRSASSSTIEPAKLKVIEHVRLKYVCKDCEAKAAEGGPQIATAEKPLSPIEKGLAAPGLLAYVIVSKYATTCRYTGWSGSWSGTASTSPARRMCDWMRPVGRGAAAAVRPDGRRKCWPRG